LTVFDIINRRAAEISGKLVEWRRALHRIPEPGFQETKTSAFVKSVLDEIKPDFIQTGLAGTGLKAYIKGAGPGPVAAVRADMDGLPVSEENNLPWKSARPGFMHACGHDGHMAVCLGAALILSGLRDRMRGGVVFLFQPAEESSPGGAGRMVQEGALSNPDVQAVFGLHLSPNFPAGSAGVSAGPVMAASYPFKFEIKGKGGHGAHPESCANPVSAGVHICNAINAARSALSGTEECVAAVCSFEAPGASNVVPDSAVLKGSLRAFRAPAAEKMISGMRAAALSAEAVFGVSCHFECALSTPAVVCDAGLTGTALEAARLAGLRAEPYLKSMGSEDFSRYLEKIPGTHIQLGAAPAKTAEPLHSPRFDFDERALPLGAALLAACALRFQGADTGA
jgi:amidohydrolase